jgi:hypothetical protein
MIYIVEVGEGVGGWRHVIGRTSDLSVAHAIFEAAVRDRPADGVVLRRGTAVLLRSGG